MKNECSTGAKRETRARRIGSAGRRERIQRREKDRERRKFFETENVTHLHRTLTSTHLGTGGDEETSRGAASPLALLPARPLSEHLPDIPMDMFVSGVWEGRQWVERGGSKYLLGDCKAVVVDVCDVAFVVGEKIVRVHEVVGRVLVCV